MIARKVALIRTLVRLGPKRLLLVYRHRQNIKSGAYERSLPVRDWSSTGFDMRLPFVLPTEASVPRGADRIIGGELEYFSWKWLPKPSTWRENPFNEFVSPTEHWSKLKDFDERQGDIKWIWEPSRFDWAVTLARAYAATQEEKFRAKFTELLEDWRSNNRPNEGVNWYCGQECSLRMLSLLFAATVFDAEAERSLISNTVSELATRVEPTIGYAIGQHNNHGTSEAAGLYVAGMCLPNHPSAPRWRELGKRVLCQLVREQFAEDGSYVQHSFIYQRLAMRACLVSFACARKFGDPFPSDVEDLILRSAKFLRALMLDDEKGRLPNYGANDGADALTLSDCSYLDFRPIVQLTVALLAGERVFPVGPWDEELAWFGIRMGPRAMGFETLMNRTVRFEDGGYYVIRREESETGMSGFMRAPKYHDGRPGQADALHVDVWFGGDPIAIDSGSFSYNDAQGWSKHFKSSGAHNTIKVDGKDQMPLASRFLYTHWTRSGAPLPRENEDGMVCFDVGNTSIFANDPEAVLGISHAYEQLGLGVRHDRLLQRLGASLQVTDMLAAKGHHQYILHWHLAGVWELVQPDVLSRRDGVSLKLASDHDFRAQIIRDSLPEAAVSEHYGGLTPITLVRVEFEGATCSFTSVFCPPHDDAE